MTEREYCTLLLHKLRKIKGSWWYKIPDMTPCPRCGAMSVGAVRPFDFIGNCNGLAIAIEVKQRSIVALTSHQRMHLKNFADSGGLAIAHIMLANNNFVVGAGGHIVNDPRQLVEIIQSTVK